MTHEANTEFCCVRTMCRLKAATAKREMEYWLAEAEEWRKQQESSDPSKEAFPFSSTGLNIPAITKQLKGSRPRPQSSANNPKSVSVGTPSRISTSISA